MDEIKKDEQRVTEQIRTVKLADGKEYSIKPLSLLDTKKLLPLINKMDTMRADEGISDALVDLMGDVCFVILKRTNTELTKEKVLEIVELESVYTIVLMGAGRILK